MGIEGLNMRKVPFKKWKKRDRIAKTVRDKEEEDREVKMTDFSIQETDLR